MKPINLAILWHMHQPMYRLRGEASCFMPWVRLHSIAAYHDMVRVLEEFPEIRVTFNLVPTLVEQIKAYVDGGSDIFWDVAARAPDDLGDTERNFLLEHFFSVHHERVVGAIPRYAQLFARAQQARRVRGDKDAWKEFSSTDFADLAALFDLAWFGFKAREDFPEIEALRKKGSGYTREDIHRIHEVQKTVIRRVLPLYKAAQARGQIEISASPYAHPILPLLIDTEAAREANREMPLPERFAHREDAQRQVQDAQMLFEREFGARPKGFWPSEGSLSQEAAKIYGSCGVKWIASDEGVLAHSEREGSSNPRHAWELSDSPHGMSFVFRDRDLSDRIGFNYARRDPKESARDFVSTAVARATQSEEKGCMVAVILDGENAWEHFPESGARFLRSLYAEIRHSKDVVSTTMSGAIADCSHRRKIKRVHAGSWINSDFGIWIGGPEKNRAWNVLGRVRTELANDLEAGESVEEAKRLAWESIRSAESSDWFWWLDGQFSSSYRTQFDDLFRGHMRQAYEALGKNPPEFLSWSVPAAKVRRDGVMGEPFEWLSPRLDGYESDIFEWHGALILPWSTLSSASTMQRSYKPLESIRIGFSRAGELLLRVDPVRDQNENPFKDLEISLHFRVGDVVRKVLMELDEVGNLKNSWLFLNEAMQPCGGRATARKILEVSVPCEEVGLVPGTPALLKIEISSLAGEIGIREIRLFRPESAHMTLMAGVP